MRRKKEGLGYWLRHSSPEQPPGFLHRLLLMIGRWIGWAEPSPRVHDISVDLVQGEIPAWPLDLFKSVTIIDGLPAVASGAAGHSHSQSVSPRVISINLAEEAKPGRVELSFTKQTRVHSEPSLLQSQVGTGKLELLLGSVRKLKMVAPDSTAVQTGRYWFYKRPLPIHTDTLRLLKAPHLRWSREPGTLNLRDSEGFLREAGRLRGIRHGNGEVLAVFTRVPIELVADYRYIKEKQLLIYTLALDKRTFTTRIHDLAAIREKTTGKTYLVADPSRYQTAVLN